MRILIACLIFMSLLFGIKVQTQDNRGVQLRLHTLGWQTNWKKHLIDYEELLSGGPNKDGIPPIDDPNFVSMKQAKTWVASKEPVILVKINDEVKIYPLQILMWHEIVNDKLSDSKIAVTFCPLCNASIVFNRELDGKTYDFGTSGLLRHSDLVMYDRQTESLWQQFTGVAIVGDEVGKVLKPLASSIISFEQAFEQFPKAQVLSKQTGYQRDYGRNPYVGYDDIDQNPFMLKQEPDGRLEPMRRVATLHYKGIDKAYAFDRVKQKGVINDQLKDQSVVLFYLKGVNSALNRSSISSSKDVGSVVAYKSFVKQQRLTFFIEDKKIKDHQTRSVWNIFGEAISGELKGAALETLNVGQHFWFAWAVFKPNTLIYK